MTTEQRTRIVKRAGIIACMAMAGAALAVAQYLAPSGGGNDEKCQTAPTSKQALKARKAEAHALSRDSNREFHLRSSSPPKPATWREYVKDDAAAIALGKALFWDQQVGSDNKMACATCHHSAGVDGRTKGSFDFAMGGTFDPAKDWAKSAVGNDLSNSKKMGYVQGDSTEVVGSVGIEPKKYVKQADGRVGVEKLGEADDEVKAFGALRDGVKKQVTTRQAPTVINAVFHDRLFHDGRASSVFNGVDPFGDSSFNADKRLLYKMVGSNMVPVSVRIENAAAASQALAPAINLVEMSYKGRDFVDIAQKLLPLTPLALQAVHSSDSVLGPLRKGDGKGLNTTYAAMVRAAFREEWWKQSDNAQRIAAGLEDMNPDRTATMMDVNFSMFFGLAIMAYEGTLISDDSKFDRFQRGDASAMTQRELRGELLFRMVGCADCHVMPEFAGAGAIGFEFEGGPAAAEGAAEDEEKERRDYAEFYKSAGTPPPVLKRPLNPDGRPVVEAMAFFKQPPSYKPNWGLVWRPYDAGFYNIGVTGIRLIKDGNETEQWDLGVGKFHAPDEDEGDQNGAPPKALAPPFSQVDADIAVQRRLVKKKAGGYSIQQQTVEQFQMLQLQNNKKAPDPAPQAAPQDGKGKPGFQLSFAKARYGRRAAVDGAFKTPTLRNVELTAPYMHNGALASLTQVVNFYRQGPRSFPGKKGDPAAEFIHPELKMLQAILRDVDPANPAVRKQLGEEIAAELETIRPALDSLRYSEGADSMDGDLVAFMLSLTDERVRKHAAPFDHPSLGDPSADGELVPAVGAPGQDVKASPWTEKRKELDGSTK